LMPGAEIKTSMIDVSLQSITFKCRGVHRGDHVACESRVVQIQRLHERRLWAPVHVDFSMSIAFAECLRLSSRKQRV
jgi:hypothetical protein